MERPELLLLGEISGKLDGLKGDVAEVKANQTAMDARLRAVEQKAAVNGAISGGAMSIGIALVIEGLKQWVSRGGAGH